MHEMNYVMDFRMFPSNEWMSGDLFFSYFRLRVSIIMLTRLFFKRNGGL